MDAATGNIYCGLYEFVDMAIVLHPLRPGDLFIDVGANIGSYNVLAAGACGADVVAIEPEPEAARAHGANIDINGLEGRAEIVAAAAGPAAGIARLTRGLGAMNSILMSRRRSTGLCGW